MANLYTSRPKHHVALDCIVFGFEEGELKVLTVKRYFEPLKDQWSLPGDFLEDKESLDQAANRVLHQLTGLKNIYLEQFKTYGEPGRDIAARVISVAYFALIELKPDMEIFGPDFQAHWFAIGEVPRLVFDHDQMLHDALRQVQHRAKNRPIGFELLPERFTMPQLQRLYECIYQREFDRRNFSKKMLSTGLLHRQNEKLKGASKKGAFLYRFDAMKYQELSTKGFYVDFT
ncbi:MAG: NUDIX hydrolase [Cytophagales bacterium]|nr:NUDIX hydrolase [Cytophagales bacterium]